MADDTKEYNRDKPFSRIKYPHFGETGPKGETQLGGRGSDCGCNSPDDYPFSIFSLTGIAAAIISKIRRVMNAVPGWVPALTDIGLGDEERETQGPLARSFQTWTDVPLRQWHFFYDWNFHITPDKGFDFCRGEANVETSAIPDEEVTTIRGGTEVKKMEHFGPVVKGNNMECEWDTGAFGKRPGAMFRRHWHWPMTGEQVWCAGRPIYDCGHPNAANRTRSELHPVKAVATAHYECESFPASGDRHIPAIKFMFFGCRLGGYFHFDRLNDKDYEFIVDLPKTQFPKDPFPIGHTPDFAHNTIVVRPRLLIKFDYQPFKDALAEAPNKDLEEPMPSFGQVTPIVTLLENFDPEKPQARVKIPLTGLSADAFGVIVSMGWFEGGPSKKIKQVTVTFESIRTGAGVHTEDDTEEDEDTGETRLQEHWNIKLAVNGRWFFFDSVTHSVDVQKIITLNNMTHTMFLTDDDTIRISAHGAQINSVDEMMQKKRNDRMVTFQPFPFVDGTPVDFIRDVQNGNKPGPPTAKNKPQRLPRQQDVFREFVFKMIPFRDQSAPLGLLDRALKVSDMAEGDVTLFFPVFFTSEVGESAELAETTAVIDYVVRTKITVKTED